jgi:hypothetical protein
MGCSEKCSARARRQATPEALKFAPLVSSSFAVEIKAKSPRAPNVPPATVHRVMDKLSFQGIIFTRLFLKPTPKIVSIHITTMLCNKGRILITAAEYKK